MGTQASLKQRVRRLERQLTILGNLIVVIGDEIYGGASREDIQKRMRQAAADVNELGSDTSFDTDR